MGAASYAEMDVGFRQAKVREKGIGHIGIVVLAGVDDNGLGPVLFLQRMVKRRYLHEIRPRGTYQMYSHFAIQLHPILFSNCCLEKKVILSSCPQRPVFHKCLDYVNNMP